MFKRLHTTAIFFIVTLVLVFFANFSNVSAQQQEFNFNFMAYNFPSADKNLLDSIAKMVNDYNISVIVIQESYEPGDAKNELLSSLRQYNPKWNMKYTNYVEGSPVDAYVYYSLWPLSDVVWENIYFGRKANSAVVNTPVGDLRVYNVHTSTRDDSTHVCDTDPKYNQLQNIINFIADKSQDGLPYVVGGDFNARLSVLDNYKNCLEEKTWFRENHVVSCVDVSRPGENCSYTVGDSSSEWLIDYVLIPNNNPNIRMDSAWVSSTKFHPSIREHYPVFATINLKGEPASVTPTPVVTPSPSPIISPTPSPSPGTTKDYDVNKDGSVGILDVIGLIKIIFR